MEVINHINIYFVNKMFNYLQNMDEMLFLLDSNDKKFFN